MKNGTGAVSAFASGKKILSYGPMGIYFILDGRIKV